MTSTGKPGIAISQDGTAICYQTLGAGEGLVVLGGAWRSARDYLPFARALTSYFTVHVVDRRGRGGSGPQGENYSIDRELEDLVVVHEQVAVLDEPTADRMGPSPRG